MIDVMKKFVAFACDFRPRVVDIALPTLSDGNMEMADTSAWITYGPAVLSKASPGYSGTRCLRSTSSALQAGCYQEVLEIGKPVRIIGWRRGTISQRVFAGGGAVFWDFPASADWQFFDVSGTADGVRLYLTSATAASGYIEFDNIQVIQPRSCIPNFGQAGGAPRWMMVGNGYTATTFPTPLAGYGATFDGGDWVDTGIVDRYENTDRFSLYFFGSLKSRTQQIISTMIAPTYMGTAFEQTTLRLYHWLVSNFGTSNANLYRVDMAGALVGARSVALVYDGIPNGAASTTFYVDGVQKTVVKDPGYTSSGSIKSGSQFILGARAYSNVGRESFILGTANAFGIADGLLTPQEIYETDTKVKAGMR